MFNHKVKIFAAAGLSFTLMTGFGLNNIKKEIAPDTDKCEDSSHESKCKNKEYIKTAVKVVAVTVAAKIMYDMVIEYRTEQVQNDKEISSEYIKKYGAMPKNSDLYEYNAKLNPVTVIEAGSKVEIKSQVKVVVGKQAKAVKVEERLDVFDNEDPDTIINTLTKTVHEGKGGEYHNYFNFTPPKGLPQGVYKVKTTVLMDGKESKQENSEMQIVLEVLPSGVYQLVASN